MGISQGFVTATLPYILTQNNFPVFYMTTFNGWTHDKYGSRFMLIAEALIGILVVLIFFLGFKQLKKKNLIPVIIE